MYIYVYSFIRYTYRCTFWYVYIYVCVYICVYIYMYIYILFPDTRSFLSFFFFNYIKYKRKINHFYRPQARDPGEQSFLVGRIRAFSSFLAKLWAIYKKWFIFWEKKKSKLFSREKTFGKLEFRETDTQISVFF